MKKEIIDVNDYTLGILDALLKHLGLEVHRIPAKSAKWEIKKNDK